MVAAFITYLPTELGWLTINLPSVPLLHLCSQSGQYYLYSDCLYSDVGLLSVCLGQVVSFPGL